MKRDNFVRSMLLVIAASLFLGCATTSKTSKADQMTTEAYVDQSIRDASETISHDLAVLAGSQQRRNMTFSMNPDGLYLPISMAWDGPVRGALSEVASTIGFKLLEEGQAPASPLIIHLKVRDRPALYILRDIGMQTGPQEGLYIDEEQKIIRLKYAEK